MTWVVVFSHQAREPLIALDAYIAAAASASVADRYVGAITDYCLSLTTFPERGVRRDGIRPGVRITNYRKRTVVAFLVDSGTERVTILGIFHGGRDYESTLSEQGTDMHACIIKTRMRNPRFDTAGRPWRATHRACATNGFPLRAASAAHAVAARCGWR